MANKIQLASALSKYIYATIIDVKEYTTACINKFFLYSSNIYFDNLTQRILVYSMFIITVLYTHTHIQN